MKEILRYILFLVLASILFTSCEDFFEGYELPRDNPLDINYNAPYSGENVLIEFDSYKITEDTNGDGIINPGEDIVLDICLKNTGEENAIGVKAKIECKSIIILTFSSFNYMYYGNIKAKEKAWSLEDNYFNMHLKVNYPGIDSVQIPIKVFISDVKDNQWEDVFYITVYSED
ncbi:MAG: hypothetical protein M0Q45_07635 [Bacteroidales bacterium]|jgi:hypothetical protein|nr:hypothetical protein [Bacteroidales bacterium]MCK9499361.1 hypothetical protein [Bacteroidales bacterium]MDY0314791.1 hypothetical protein [Bacteroidales bacterium]